MVPIRRKVPDKTHLTLAYGALAASRGRTVRFTTAQNLLGEL